METMEVSDMEFYAPNGMKRPVRLCEKTRRFAKDSLDRVYGLETKANPGVVMDHVPGFGEMTKLERYDLALTEIVTKAPLRICPDERLSGAATWGSAINHFVPAY